jgi:anthranilate phosphoribosyltransferase
MLTPESLGMLQANSEDIKGGSPKENARDLLCIFKGQKGPKRDIVVLNAAAALYVGGIVGSIRQAIPIAEDSIDSGKVMVKFNQFRTFTSGLYEQNSKGTLPRKDVMMRSGKSILSPVSGERA